MSTIADFFAVAATSNSLETSELRVTHGTTCYLYTYGCCSTCTFTLPAKTVAGQEWAYEMWGQGGGGGSGCCCYYSPYGGSGGEYGAARQERGTSCFPLCMCACSCWCCYYNGMEGHPGQLSRICEGAVQGLQFSTGGGYRGWTCCNYLWSYPNDCNMGYAVQSLPFMTSGGGGTPPTCRFADLNCYINGNADPIGDPIVSLAASAEQEPPAAAVASLPGSFENVNCYFRPVNVCCQCGTHTSTIWNCNVSERIIRAGSCGYANGSLGNTGVSGNDYLGIGIGGAGFSGGNAQMYHSCSASWNWSGCMGVAPGGGGSSSGGCSGGCCWGSIGGAGLVIISYDN